TGSSSPLSSCSVMRLCAASLAVYMVPDNITVSPLFSFSISPSSNGTSKCISAIPSSSNDEIFMSACMTVQVDSNRKRCNMTRCCFNLYIECSSIAAEPLRPDAEFIDRLMDLPFKIGDAFNRMSLTDRTEQRLFSKIRSDFEIPADSYADH